MIEGFGGHHPHLVAHCRQYLETPIEDQLDTGKALVQGIHHAHQPGLLGSLVKTGNAPIGIEGVEKEAAIAFFPQGSDHVLGKETSVPRLRQIYHAGAPGLILGAQPVGRKGGEPGAGGLHFAHGHIGIQGAVAPSAIGDRVGAVIRLDNNHIKGLEFIQRRRGTVVQRHRGRSRCPRHPQQGNGEQGHQGATQIHC